MKLDVRVHGQKVASLFREADQYAMQYEASASEDQFVSLAMPVRAAPWMWPRDLHPFFQQNLPEGYLLAVIREEFGPFLDGTDLSILAVVGAMGVGRVTVTPEGAAVGAPLQGLDIKDILQGDNTEEHFAGLVRQYARAAISGAVPKFLAPDLEVRDIDYPLGKSTFRTSRYIVKGSDANTPFLGFNERYTMRVLERANVVPVARTHMSEDGRALVVERFDVNEQGVPVKGLEDLCSLLGLAPKDKYSSTTEQVIDAVSEYIPGAALRAQMEHLGWLILTTYVVRNADCHTKNIGLLYSGLDDVALTPVYDMVTTHAYPKFAKNPPGLFVDGRKTWVASKTLERLFNTRLGIKPSMYKKMVETVCEAAIETGREVLRAAKEHPEWKDLACNIVHAWNDGMESVRSAKKGVSLRGLTAHIEAAGCSRPPHPEKPEPVGRSPLLAKSGQI